MIIYNTEYTECIILRLTRRWLLSVTHLRAHLKDSFLIQAVNLSQSLKPNDEMCTGQAAKFLQRGRKRLPSIDVT